jgi:hypothetical protein
MHNKGRNKILRKQEIKTMAYVIASMIVSIAFNVALIRKEHASM